MSSQYLQKMPILYLLLTSKVTFEDIYTADIQYQSGRHNLRSFPAANSTQNYFLIAHMLSFCDISNKSAVSNILQQNVTNFDVGNGERGRKGERKR